MHIHTNIKKFQDLVHNVKLSQKFIIKNKIKKIFALTFETPKISIIHSFNFIEIRAANSNSNSNSNSKNSVILAELELELEK